MRDIWPAIVRTVMNGKVPGKGREEAEGSEIGMELAKARLLHRGAAHLPLAEGAPTPTPSSVCWPICPEAVAAVLAVIVQQERLHCILPDFFALLERRRWRFPPEWLPQVLEAVLKLREEDLARALFRFSGPWGLWLAGQHPRWKGFFKPVKLRQRRNTPTVPEQSAHLRVRWPDLAYPMWKRCVLSWMSAPAAWASADGALTLALTQGRHPWPDQVLPFWRAYLEKARSKHPHQISAHELALVRAAALRSSPERILEVSEDASTWPYGWQNAWNSAREVAALRLRLRLAFQQAQAAP